MTEWQPIDTAPKNDAGEMLGPTILIWYEADSLPWPAYWGPNMDAIAEGAWMIDGGAPFDTALVTHWQPPWLRLSPFGRGRFGGTIALEPGLQVPVASGRPERS